jgi:UDP-N-acetyl-D-mannosaminuronate dehydrogenase
MADRAVDLIRDTLGGLDRRRVLVLGASYRENVKELAFSTAIRVVERLHRDGAHVLIHDPYFEPAELAALEAEVADLRSKAPLDVDAIVVQAFHNDYRDLEWTRFRGLKAVFDGRGLVDPEPVRAAGARYLTFAGTVRTGA